MTPSQINSPKGATLTVNKIGYSIRTTPLGFWNYFIAQPKIAQTPAWHNRYSLALTIPRPAAKPIMLITSGVT